MRDLGKKELDRRKLIQKTINDYFGAPVSDNFNNRLFKAMKDRHFRDLETSEILHARHIAENLKDTDYMEALLWG